MNGIARRSLVLQFQHFVSTIPPRGKTYLACSFPQYGHRHSVHLPAIAVVSLRSSDNAHLRYGDVSEEDASSRSNDTCFSFSRLACLSAGGANEKSLPHEHL